MCFGVRLSGDVRWSGGEARGLASVPSATWWFEQLGDPNWETPMQASPAGYNSALVRPRWRVVSTVKVRAGVLP